MKRDIFRAMRSMIDLFLWVGIFVLVATAAESVFRGDMQMAGICLALLAVCMGWIVHRSADFRWFRKACFYPCNIFVDPGGFYTDSEPVCRLYCGEDAPMVGKTFSLCFGLVLPPQGGQKVSEAVMADLEEWMARQSCSMRLRGQMSANCQIAEVEMCVLRKDASPAVLESMYDCYERVAKENFELYARRYIRVDYPERGHVFYAAFDGFDIGRAVIRSEGETAFTDLGDSRHSLILASDTKKTEEEYDAVAESMSRAFSLYLEDCRIEHIRHGDLIGVERFEELWRSQPSSPQIRQLQLGGNGYPAPEEKAREAG